MQNIARQNDGMRYLLIVIDVFSKFAWTILVHSKNANNHGGVWARAYNREFTQAQRLPTDKGKKLINSNFMALMKYYGISHFANESEQMAALVERFNRTIITRIWT